MLVSTRALHIILVEIARVKAQLETATGGFKTQLSAEVAGNPKPIIVASHQCYIGRPRGCPRFFPSQVQTALILILRRCA
jgi:hypothetical protein